MKMLDRWVATDFENNRRGIAKPDLMQMASWQVWLPFLVANKDEFFDDTVPASLIPSLEGIGAYTSDFFYDKPMAKDCKTAPRFPFRPPMRTDLRCALKAFSFEEQEIGERMALETSSSILVLAFTSCPSVT